MRIATPQMGRVGAVARVHFTKTGVSHMQTKGEDNVLRLTVTVH